MYGNIYKEIKLRKLNQAKICESLGVSRRTLINKLSGKTDFLAQEMVALQKEFFPDLTLEYLFEKG